MRNNVISIDKLRELHNSRSELAVKQRVRKPRGRSEHDLQVACVNWFRLCFPKEIIFAIPNGGARNLITGKKLKAEGVLAGVPDLFIPKPCGIWHGLFIEMKRGSYGRVSSYQEDTMVKLINIGYKCVVCRDAESFMNTVKDYFSL